MTRDLGEQRGRIHAVSICAAAPGLLYLVTFDRGFTLVLSPRASSVASSAGICAASFGRFVALTIAMTLCGCSSA
jgi:hypothetical protein